MEMKEEWLMPGAVVPVDAETTAALVAEIKRLIGVVGDMALNMQPAQQQEPVALDVTIDDEDALAALRDTIVQSDGDLTGIRLLVGNGHSGYGLYVANAEYQEEGALLLANTSPPASKPWVGLTQQDIHIAFDDTQEGGGFDEFARVIEAKLREKNNG